LLAVFTLSVFCPNVAQNENKKNSRITKNFILDKCKKTESSAIVLYKPMQNSNYDEVQVVVELVTLVSDTRNEYFARAYHLPIPADKSLNDTCLLITKVVLLLERY
jgi:hypothetical protein